MEKFKKLSKEEMKEVLGGAGEPACKDETPCPSGKSPMLVGCPSGNTYYICE